MLVSELNELYEPYTNYILQLLTRIVDNHFNVNMLKDRLLVDEREINL